MKKRIMNIRLQEVVTNGKRTVQYKSSNGKYYDIAAGNGESDGDSTAPSNIVLKVKLNDNGKAFTADELSAMITGIMAGKVLVCISETDNINELRIATLARVRGFSLDINGGIIIGDTLTFELSMPSAKDDIETVSFLKKNDGNYRMSNNYKV